MHKHVPKRIALLVAMMGVTSSPFLLTHAEGIPEPERVSYGVIRNTQGGQNVRLTEGTLSWIFRPTSGGADVVLTGQLTNLYDQFSFVLKIPCESQLGALTTSSNVLKLTSTPQTYDQSNILLDGKPVYLKYPTQTLFTLTGTNRGVIERVDLVLSRDEQDDDGDGLPNWWETLFFRNTTNGIPSGDADLDGVSNLAEYKAGTNPTNALSLFEFINIRPEPLGGIRVEWSSVSNRTYILQRSSGLSGPFVDILTDIAATPPVNSRLDWTAVGIGPFFYRLQLQESSPSPADADSNGMADEWERLHFGQIRNDPNADPDRDGLTNLAEFKAGTNPTDSSSLLKLYSIASDAQRRVFIQWFSVVNKHYSIFRSSDPKTGYQVIAIGYGATPPMNTYMDDAVPAGIPSFYRVMVEP